MWQSQPNRHATTSYQCDANEVSRRTSSIASSTGCHLTSVASEVTASVRSSSTVSSWNRGSTRSASSLWETVCTIFDLGPTTEGFYDTASHRSQQVSQHPTVYQKETALPKRRCPRRGKPKRHNGAIARGKPNGAPRTKPWPCVKIMLADTVSHQNGQP